MRESKSRALPLGYTSMELLLRIELRITGYKAVVIPFNYKSTSSSFKSCLGLTKFKEIWNEKWSKNDKYSWCAYTDLNCGPID